MMAHPTERSGIREVSEMGESCDLLSAAGFEACAPYSAAGYRKFRTIIESDGALPRRIKALFVAVSAAAKGHIGIASRELKRGKEFGLSAESASAGVIVLSSLRGEGAALAYLDAMTAQFGELKASSAPNATVDVAKGEAHANFEHYFGTVPAPLQVLCDLLPDGADAYYLMRKGSIESNPLDKKYAELMLLTVLAADYSPMCAMHVKGARAAGASDQEIGEALICAIPAAGVAAWIAGAAHIPQSE